MRPAIGWARDLGADDVLPAEPPRLRMWEFDLERAAWPFLFSPDTLWRTLPGERYAFPIGGFNPRGTSEPRCGVERRLARDFTVNPSGDVTSHYVHIGEGRQLDPGELLARLTMRALQKQKPWVRNTGGVAGWSVWERYSIQGFLLLLGRQQSSTSRDCWPPTVDGLTVTEHEGARQFGNWIRALELDVGALKRREGERAGPASGKIVAPARVMAEQLLLELRAARGALGALENLLRVAMNYGSGGEIVHVGQYVDEAANWFAGALGNVQEMQASLVRQGKQFGSDLGRTEAGQLLTNVVDFQAVIETMLQRFGDQMGSIVSSALAELRAEVAAMARDALAEIGIEITSETFGQLLPVIGRFIEAAVALVRHLTREEKPPAFPWKRGNLDYTHPHLNAYGMLAYRAYLQHRRRMYAIFQEGRITWDPGPLGVPAPPSLFVVKQREPPRPVEPAKALSPTGKAALAVGLGGGVVGLVWWLLRRRR